MILQYQHNAAIAFSTVYSPSGRLGRHAIKGFRRNLLDDVYEVVSLLIGLDSKEEEKVTCDHIGAVGWLRQCCPDELDQNFDGGAERVGGLVFVLENPIALRRLF